VTIVALRTGIEPILTLALLNYITLHFDMS